MTKLTVEKLSLFTALKNIGSILPLLLSIHTLIISLILPRLFDNKVKEHYFVELFTLYFAKKKLDKK
jgi:hypothetical protein